jgi:hypothetical protein
MSESITITRLEHDVFTVERGGETVRFDACENVPEVPGCWSMVNQMYYAIKAAHGHLARRVT